MEGGDEFKEMVPDKMINNNKFNQGH